jgi:photosystem II stability/assembly factor-like uncharacterized protein
MKIVLILSLLTFITFKSYSLDSLVLLSKWENQIRTSFQDDDTSHFNDFNLFLDSLLPEDNYSALCICHDNILDSTIQTKDYGTMEEILLHNFYPLFNRFWMPYYLNDSVFFKYAVNKLNELDTTNGLFFFLHYSIPAFTINLLEMEMVNWPDNMIGHFHSIIDSIATQIQTNMDYPDEYRSKLVRFSFLEEMYTKKAITRSKQLVLSVDSTFNGIRLSDIFILNSSNIFICGEKGVFAHTSDRSTGWNEHIINQTNLKKVVFQDSMHGFLLTESNSLYKTNNGGASWIQYEQFIDKEVLDLFFFDGNKGILSTQTGTMITNDGGSTWTLQSEGVHFNFIIAENRILSYFPSWLRYSDDNGVTWKTIGDSFVDQYNISINGLFFKDSLTGFCYGNNGVVVKTTDGGKSWVEIPIPFAGDINSLIFFNEDKGIILGDPFTILTTSNSGQSWENDSLFVFDEIIECITIDSTTAMMISESGKIYTLSCISSGVEHYRQINPSKKPDYKIRGNQNSIIISADALTKGMRYRVKIISLNGRVLYNELFNTDNRNIVIQKKDLNKNDRLVILSITNMSKRDLSVNSCKLLSIQE